MSTSNDLLELLPHRPPMRLLEEIVEVVAGRSARARRRAHPGDWYFDGHFPGDPVVPAIILVEMLAQTGGLAAHKGGDHASSPKTYRVAAFAGFKFPAGAGPGSLLEVEARVVAELGNLVRIEGEVKADGRTVAIGGITLAELPSPTAAATHAKT